MNEEQLRRDIEEALAVEPSPQFLARVRRQLEAESRRSRFRLPWKVLAAGLATGIVLAGLPLVALRTSHLPVPTATTIRLAAPAVEEQIQELPATELPLRPKDSVQAVIKRSPQPQVIIDPRETAALRSFLNDVQERRIDPNGLGELFDLAEHAARPARIIPATIIGFEPIVVKPLNLTASDEGGSL
ncbi:MAG TPA: hypothetical protein VFR05_04640 [Terriglobia bacterium]|nr:hypothetical protein [Terriglobia bacterium]